MKDKKIKHFTDKVESDNTAACRAYLDAVADRDVKLESRSAAHDNLIVVLGAASDAADAAAIAIAATLDTLNIAATAYAATDSVVDSDTATAYAANAHDAAKDARTSAYAVIVAIDTATASHAAIVCALNNLAVADEDAKAADNSLSATMAPLSATASAAADADATNLGALLD